MNVQITLSDAASPESTANLKSFIDHQGIPGIATDIERKAVPEGAMGVGDLLLAVKAIIEAAQAPLTELVKCLQKYVENYRTSITIETPNGKVQIDRGRNTSAADVEKIIAAIKTANPQ
jgi:hypothetical protein